MMQKEKFIYFILIFLVLMFYAPLNANDTFNGDAEIEVNYRRLFSSNFTERADAVEYFYGLKKDKLDERYMKALIGLFKREVEQLKKFNDFLQKGGTAATLPKEIAYWNNRRAGLYHLYLCGLVSKSGDKSLLNLILKNCGDPESIANLGEDAVEPVLDALKTSKSTEGKTSRIDMLGEMLKPKLSGYVASGNTRKKIKELLIQYTKDGDRYVRLASIKALGESQDKDIIPIIDDVAKNDPYFYEKKDESTGNIERVYPVRMTAKEVLEKLKKTNK